MYSVALNVIQFSLAFSGAWVVGAVVEFYLEDVLHVPDVVTMPLAIFAAFVWATCVALVFDRYVF